MLPAAPLLLMVANTVLSQSLPPVQTKTLDGKPVVLPGERRTKPLLLLLGFSHKSDDDFKKWAERARTPYVSDSRIDYYELVDLQGVPSIIDKMFVHGMRRAVKEPRRPILLRFISTRLIGKCSSSTMIPKSLMSF
jgi:hypothetical protein